MLIGRIFCYLLLISAWADIAFAFSDDAGPQLQSNSVFLNRRGFEIELNGGMNYCMNSVEVHCKDKSAAPGAGAAAVAAFRFLRFLSTGVTFGYHSLGYDGELLIDKTKLRLLHGMVLLRFYLPFRPVDVYLSTGLGYGQISIRGTAPKNTFSDTDSDFSATSKSWLNLKAGFGATYYFLQHPMIGEFGAGLNADYIFFYPTSRKLCFDGVCETELAEWDTINTLQASAHLTWIIPLFTHKPRKEVVK